MRVSGKITHSFYCFLQARGFDVSRLFELTSLEMEFLKDPSQWMSLAQVESLLNKLNHEYSMHFVDQDFLTGVGHACFELSAWGELDSVLKMRQSEPLFSHLPVFLSYFVSDGFSITSERNEPGFLSFKSNLSAEEYPCVTEYLRAVMETLPLYAGKPRAEVKWIRDYIQLRWEDPAVQTSLFATPSEVNIKPELLTDLRQFLEKVEKELYHQRQVVADKNQEIRKLKDQLLLQGVALPQDISLLLNGMERALFELKGALAPVGAGTQVSGKKEEEGEAPPSSEELYSQADSLLRLLVQLKEALKCK